MRIELWNSGKISRNFTKKIIISVSDLCRNKDLINKEIKIMNLLSFRLLL